MPSQQLRRAVGKFVKWSDRLLKARAWTSAATLYHYTSVTALKGILRSQELWLTPIRAQRKDPTELAFGLDLFRGIVNQNLAAASASQLHRDFLAAMAVPDVHRVIQAYDCHLACFAPHGEDFDLWERHGDNGRGVAIGVRSSWFAETGPVRGEPNWYVQPVTYGDAAPLHEFRKVLQTASLALGRIAPLVESREDEVYVLEQIVGHVFLGHVLARCMLAKSSDFVPEMEVRVVSPRVRAADDGPVASHVAIPLPKGMIAEVLVGENGNRRSVSKIVTAAGLPAAIVRTADFSSGLATNPE